MPRQRCSSSQGAALVVQDVVPEPAQSQPQGDTAEVEQTRLFQELCEERQALTSAVRDLDKAKADLEQEKRLTQELKGKVEVLEEEKAELAAQLQRATTIDEKLRNDNRSKVERMERLQRDLVFTEDRLRIMESRAMEAEKLDLAMEGLRRQLDTTQTSVREKEHEQRSTHAELEDTKKQLKVAQTKICHLDEKVDDLKLQVREEVTRNAQMEMDVEEMARLRERTSEQGEKLAILTQQLQDKELLLQDSRKACRQQRELNQHLQQQITALEVLHEDLSIAHAETASLKSLLVGKDALLLQQMQRLQRAQEALQEKERASQASSPRSQVTIATTDSLPSWSNGCQSRSAGIVSHEGTRSSTRPAAPPTSTQQGCGNRKIFLDVNNLPYNSVQEQVVNSERGSGELPAASKGQLGSSSLLQTLLNEDNDNNFVSATRKQPARRIREPKTAVVRPQAAIALPSTSHHRPFSNFRTEQENKVKLTDSNGNSCTSEFQNQEQSSGSLTAAELEQVTAQLIRYGDRVLVDLGRKRNTGLKEALRAGKVKYVGNVDRAREDLRLYVGVRLDDPAGDMGGLYNGKRYFFSPAKHGKLVHIARVKSIFNKKVSKYQNVKDLVRQVVKETPPKQNSHQHSHTSADTTCEDNEHDSSKSTLNSV